MTFAGPTQAWPRAARLDAPRVLDRIFAITGVRLVLEGPCPGGEVGAAYVRWPDGRRSVLTAARTQCGPLADRARTAGVPTARHELTARVDGVRVVVQQRLPGRRRPPSTPPWCGRCCRSTASSPTCSPGRRRSSPPSCI
ncbi:hypothetical protein [Paractinoplanes durhamensis]|uniref:hypothetical protein n=1 Tax=Paractinoplanes durhamensis TaxID=113563 RepID=UPI00362B43DA